MAGRGRGGQGGGPDPRVLLDQLRAWLILAALVLGALFVLWALVTYNAPAGSVGPLPCPQTAQGPCGNDRLTGAP